MYTICWIDCVQNILNLSMCLSTSPFTCYNEWALNLWYPWGFSRDFLEQFIYLLQNFLNTHNYLCIYHGKSLCSFETNRVYWMVKDSMLKKPLILFYVNLLISCCLFWFSLCLLNRDNKNENQDDSIWLKEKWSIGEVRNTFLVGQLDGFILIF